MLYHIHSESLIILQRHRRCNNSILNPRYSIRLLQYPFIVILLLNSIRNSHTFLYSTFHSLYLLLPYILIHITNIVCSNIICYPSCAKSLNNLYSFSLILRISTSFQINELLPQGISAISLTYLCKISLHCNPLISRNYTTYVEYDITQISLLVSRYF